MTNQRLIAALASVLVTLSLATACDASITFGDGVDGSGELVSEIFEVDDFDAISVENSFDVVVRVGDTTSVEVVVDDNLVDDLDVRSRGGQLVIGLRNGVSIGRATLEATVVVPELVGVEVSGASTVEIMALAGGSFDIDASGASDLRVEGVADRVDVGASGASRVEIDLDRVDEIVVDVSGASTVEVRTANSVRGEISGASDLTVPSDAAVDVSASGASDIHRR